MATEIGKAYVQIVPKAEGISGSISSVLDGESEKAGKSAGLSLASGMGSALKGATSLITAGTALFSGAVVKGTSDVAAYGDNIDKMSQKMGLSAQAYQEWDAVMQHSGTSMEAMKASMKTLANAAQTNSKAFEELGLTQEQIAGMSQEQLFEATISALQNVEDTTTRTYLAGKTLGRGATELGALLNTSAEETQAMRDRVRELGGVMSDDAVKAAAAFQDNMQDLKTAIGGVSRNMMSQLLPSMNTILAGFTSLIAGEEGATEQLSQGFGELFTSLDDIAKSIVSAITDIMPGIINGLAEVLPEMISMATSLIVSLADALVNALPTLLTTVIPALAEAAIQIVVSLGDAIINAAPNLVNAGVSLMDTLKNSFNLSEMLEKGQETVKSVLDGITTKLPDVLSKGIEIITNVVNGILSSLPEIIRSVTEMIRTFVEFLSQNAPTIMKSGMELLMNVVQGILDNLPEIISATVELIGVLIQTIVENLPQIIEMGFELVTQLIVGLVKALPDLVAGAWQLVTGIADTFTSFDWIEIGKNLVQGIINGIKSMATAIWDAAKSVALDAFNAAKDALGIASPAKKGIYIGEMLDEGFALGVENKMGLVDDAVSELADTSVSTLTVANSTEFNGGNASNNWEYLFAILGKYLPEISEREGINASDLYNGLNRQLGWAVQ